MAKPRKLANGRWQISVENTGRGIPRTKRSFETRAQALAWAKIVLEDGYQRLIGGRTRRTFGQALARYLTEHTPTKRSARDDHTHAAALRWPVWHTDAARWLLLEDVPLEDLPAALGRWTADQRRIAARSYVGGCVYQQWRDDRGALAWYEQPPPDAAGRPRPRVAVTDPAILGAIERATRKRGPFDSGTLRHRQILAKHILRLAWKAWDWLDQDLSPKIQLNAPARPRETFLDRDQLAALIQAAASVPDDPAAPHFADLIAAHALIGWRRANIVYLTWERVRWPQDADGHGYFWTDRAQTKNGDPLTHPIGPRVLELLRARWAAQNGPYVFHQGNGQPWGDYRKRFATAKRQAGIPAGFRTHDLRHTWASHAMQAGKPDQHIQDLGGWRSRQMVQRYAHLRLKHLYPSAN